MLSSDNRKVIGFICHPETGEIRKWLLEGDRIVPKAIYDSYSANFDKNNPDNIYAYHDLGEYNKIAGYAIEHLSQMGLTAGEWQLMFWLSGKLQFNSGLVEHKNHKPITNAYIASAFHVQEDSARKVLQKLQRKEIISLCGTRDKRKIYFNPYISYKGRYINKTLESMFKDTVFYRLFKNRQTP